MKKFYIRELIKNTADSNGSRASSPQPEINGFTVFPAVLEKRLLSLHFSEGNGPVFEDFRYCLIYNDSECIDIISELWLSRGYIQKITATYEDGQKEHFFVRFMTVPELLKMREAAGEKWTEAMDMTRLQMSRDEAWTFFENYFSNIAEFQHQQVGSISTANSVASQKGFRFPLAVEVGYEIVKRNLTYSFEQLSASEDEEDADEKEAGLQVPDELWMAKILRGYVLECGDRALDNGLVVGVSKSGSPLYNPEILLSGAMRRQARQEVALV